MDSPSDIHPGAMLESLTPVIYGMPPLPCGQVPFCNGINLASKVELCRNGGAGLV